MINSELIFRESQIQDSLTIVLPDPAPCAFTDDGKRRLRFQPLTPVRPLPLIPLSGDAPEGSRTTHVEEHAARTRLRSRYACGPVAGQRQPIHPGKAQTSLSGSTRWPLTEGTNTKFLNFLDDIPAACRMILAPEAASQVCALGPAVLDIALVTLLSVILSKPLTNAGLIPDSYAAGSGHRGRSRVLSMGVRAPLLSADAEADPWVESPRSSTTCGATD